MQDPSILAQGKLCSSDDTHVEYLVKHGWSLRASMDCDREWKNASIEMLNFIDQQNFDDDRLEQVLLSLSIEESHWDWFQKSLSFNGVGYEWFYLYAEEKPQGACVIFHPRQSVLSRLDIFNVEFIAVAPWNRRSLVRERRFKGVGRALLATALNFSRDRLSLSPGFSLHSLPGARRFYEDLQMVKIDAESKGALTYFELPASCAEKLMEIQ